MVFVKPLQAKAQTLLSQPILQPLYRTGGHKIMLSAKNTQSLPDSFVEFLIPAGRKEDVIHFQQF